MMHVLKRSYKKLRDNTIGPQAKGLIALKKLNELLEDIKAIRSGNFVIVD
jgi:hypothetical protein